MEIQLIKELERWSKIYSFNFQFWPRQKTCYIEKENVELKIISESETIEDCIIESLNYIYKINRVPLNKRFKSIKQDQEKG